MNRSKVWMIAQSDRDDKDDLADRKHSLISLTTTSKIKIIFIFLSLFLLLPTSSQYYLLDRNLGKFHEDSAFRKSDCKIDCLPDAKY